MLVTKDTNWRIFRVAYWETAENQSNKFRDCFGKEKGGKW